MEPLEQTLAQHPFLAARAAPTQDQVKRSLRLEHRRQRCRRLVCRHRRAVRRDN